MNRKRPPGSPPSDPIERATKAHKEMLEKLRETRKQVKGFQNALSDHQGLRVVHCEQIHTQAGQRDLLRAAREANNDLTIALSKAESVKQYLAVKAYLPVAINKMNPSDAIRAMAAHLLSVADDPVILENMQMDKDDDPDAMVLCTIEVD